MNGTKKCAGCGRVLQLSEFNRNKNNGDGLQERCRECCSAYNRKRYASDPDRFKASSRKRREENPSGCLETRLRACGKNPTHKNAYMAVDAAIKAGVLAKPDLCSGCGDSGRIEAHHHDYNRPLDVVWVCPTCHTALDSVRRVRNGGKPNGRARGVQMIRDGETVCRFDSVSAAARAVGKARTTIADCLAGRTKSAAGFEWRYEGDE